MTGRRGPGRPPNRPPVSVEASSPPRRTTRNQLQQLHQEAGQDEQQFIDPTLTETIRTSATLQNTEMPPPPLPPARRGTRSKPRASSIASSLHGKTSEVYSSDASQSPHPPSDPGFLPTNLTEFAGGSAVSLPVGGTSVGESDRGGSVSVSEVSDRARERKAARTTLTVFLPRLLTAVKDLFSHLAGGDVASDNDEDEWNDARKDLKEALEFYRIRYLTAAGDTVIRPSYVLSLMGTDAHSVLGFNASRIAAATNLVTLLDEIIQIQQIHEDEDPLPILQGWDMSFPEFFVEGPEAVQGQIPKIVGIVNNIRTQRLIFTLKKLGLAGPDAIEQTARVFCQDTVSGSTLEDLVEHKSLVSFRPIHFVNFHSGSQENVLGAKLYATRINSIVECFQNSRDLEAEILLEDLVKSLRDFVEFNFRRITEQLDAQALGRAWDPSRHFAGSNASNTSQAENQQIQSQLESESLGQALGGMGSSDPAAAAYMEQYEQAQAAIRMSSQDIIPRSNQLPSGGYPAIAPYPPGFEQAHQNGAPYTAFQGNMYAESAAQATGTKRPAQDDAAPPPKRQRNRRKKNVAPAAEASEIPSTELGTLVVSDLDPDSQYPAPPGSGSQTEPDFEAVSQRSRQLSAATRKPKEPQVRSAWVQPDIRELVKAVDKHKCKWSAIEKDIKNGIIPFARPRDQQALRDKARILKQDMLKADAPLPASFDLVVLGKKERAAVIACGKNPDRKEADVDPLGNPTNTEFQEEVQEELAI